MESISLNGENISGEKTLSICITSYNRVKELRRCLESIDANESDIEIIVSEDKSPKREEIRQTVSEFSQSSKYKVVGNFNEQNLGYDRNLAKLISLAGGRYILFCSDDDAFNKGMIQYIIDVLKEKTPAFMYTAYTSSDKKSFNRKYKECFDISGGVGSVEKFIYDGILFSGLIFETNKVRELISDMDRFINTNYFQIYMLAKMLYRFNGYYDCNELINCIGDGENAYGTTELSKKDPLLADRKNVFSNMQFNKGLIKVIKIFDAEENLNILKSFEKEYSLRSYRGMVAARSEGRKVLKKYWKELNDLDIKICFPAGWYYRILLIFGVRFSNFIFSFPRKLMYGLRRKRNA